MTKLRRIKSDPTLPLYGDEITLIEWRMLSQESKNALSPRFWAHVAAYIKWNQFLDLSKREQKRALRNLSFFPVIDAIDRKELTVNKAISLNRHGLVRYHQQAMARYYDTAEQPSSTKQTPSQ